MIRCLMQYARVHFCVLDLHEIADFDGSWGEYFDRERAPIEAPPILGLAFGCVIHASHGWLAIHRSLVHVVNLPMRA